MTAPTPPPADGGARGSETEGSLLDRLVYALVDGSCDLADRGASQDVWDQAKEDCELLLPVIAAEVDRLLTAAVNAERERFAADFTRIADGEPVGSDDFLRGRIAGYSAAASRLRANIIGHIPYGTPATEPDDGSYFGGNE